VVAGVFFGSLLYYPAKSGKSITGGLWFLLLGIVTLRWICPEGMSACNCVYSISGKLKTEVCNFYFIFLWVIYEFELSTSAPCPGRPGFFLGNMIFGPLVTSVLVAA